MTAASLVDVTRATIDAAAHAYHGRPAAAWCAALARRLDGPLRLAVAGKVKAGKSTLLNALIGARIAAVDAGECTRVVTWYEAADQPRVTMVPRGGSAVDLPVRVEEGGLAFDHAGTPVAGVDRFVVGWPAADLQRYTLIDTPGVASLSADAGGRAVRLLDPDEEGLTGEADAVVYLLRHLHAADLDLLGRLRGATRTGSVTAVAVLSRADEIGGARLDGMQAAADVAARLRADPALRGLCLDTVAVAGLLAETGLTLTPAEYDAVAAIAAQPAAVVHDALRSADHFGSLAIADPDPGRRARLLGRLGVFGLRLAVRLVQEGSAGPADLGPELVRRSGLPELRSSLGTCLESRREVLKARSVLVELRRLLRAEPAPATAVIAADIDRALRHDPHLVELRTLTALRSGLVDLPPDVVADGMRVLGQDGPDVAARLGLPPASDERECGSQARDAVRRWRERAESPVTDHATATVCRTIVRACERLATEPRAGGSPSRGAARRTS